MAELELTQQQRELLFAMRHARWARHDRVIQRVWVGHQRFHARDLFTLRAARLVVRESQPYKRSDAYILTEAGHALCDQETST